MPRLPGAASWKNHRIRLSPVMYTMAAGWSWTTITNVVTPRKRMRGKTPTAKARRSMPGWAANPRAIQEEESVIRKIEVRVRVADHAVLSNVVSSEYSALRTSLIPSLSSRR